MAESFLTQLEQRTQQVKITLANLEAEKTRIEGLIAQLQPLVPHYDALVDAERAISGANIQLEDVSAAAAGHEKSWEAEHTPPWQQSESTSSWNS